MTWPVFQETLLGTVVLGALSLVAPVSCGSAWLVNSNPVGRTHTPTKNSVTIAAHEGRRQNFRPGVRIVMIRSWMFLVEPVTANPGEACLARYSKVSMSTIASQ